MFDTVKRDCGFFNPHEWTKWEQFDLLMKHYGSIVRPLEKPVFFVRCFQKRTCINCGKEQRLDGLLTQS